jgi:DNA-binding MarR family transcriptional regulator
MAAIISRCASLLVHMSRPLRIDPIAEARRHWEARWDAADARAMAAVTSILRAQQILLARLNALLGPLGITFPRYEALMLLSFSRTGALPLGKIGERLQVHRTSVTNIIDKLEADGLVRRVPHEVDRRATLAQITDAGREIAKQATALLNANAFGAGALAPEDQESLTELLRSLRVEAGDFEDRAGEPAPAALSSRNNKRGSPTI